MAIKEIEMAIIVTMMPIIVQYSIDPPSDAAAWVSETTAHRKHTFTGLKPLVTYWFRVIAIGLNGQLAISDAVSRVIL